MNEFLEDLVEQLRTIITETYQDIAKLGQALPYLVFNFPSGNTGESDSKFSRIKMLEIDIFTRDSGDIETLTDGIDDLLNQRKLLGAGYYAWLKHEGRISLQQQDNEVRRRQLRYVVNFTKRS